MRAIALEFNGIYFEKMFRLNPPVQGSRKRRMREMPN